MIGAGVVGAACALAAARAGLSVTLLDRGPVAGGTSSACEGNLLVSDKPAGAELDLALRSLRTWRELAAHVEEVTGRGFELEAKTGLMVALQAPTLTALEQIATGQRAAGVRAEIVDAAGLADLEPHLAPGFAGGVFYPQDSQLNPMLATARLVQAARRRGAVLRTGTEVTGLARSGERVVGVELDGGGPGRVLTCDWVVNAAGPWAGAVAAMAGVELPVQPRRGVVLVTQALPDLVRRKVYAAEYVSNVASDSAGLESSAVVEGTPSGSVLVGASRERVGFDRAVPVEVLQRLAVQAITLFPVLARARVARSYTGFRPFSPDHLPMVGADPRAPGLVQATGHEGAGVVLAAVTGELVAAAITGADPVVDPRPVRPERFAEVLR